MRQGIIHYGFGKDYLPKWGLKEAFREIYQNFLDYGDFETTTNPIAHPEGHVYVQISNGWQPTDLEFLRIGKSQKDKSNPIGKHGEGLKMAFLILHRMGLESLILTPTFQIWPDYYHDKEIGECFCLRYSFHDEPIDTPFTISFQAPVEEIEAFTKNIVQEGDVIFDDQYWGQIVDKAAGNIYSGRLWVASIANISRAYNINPQHMQLDRDRAVPRAFDVNYASSKINEAYGKFTAADTAYNDTTYISRIPDDIKPDFKPVRVGNDIQFTYKDQAGKDQVVSNSSVVEALKQDSFFEVAIKKLKRFIAKQLGIYDMLVAYKTRYPMYGEALQDFELILDKVKISNHGKK